MHGLQCHILATHVVESQSVPFVGQFIGKNRVVLVRMLVRVNGDVKRCVKGTSVFIYQGEGVGYRGVMGEIIGWRDDECRVGDAGDPERVEVFLRDGRIVLAGKVFRNPHLTLKNIAVVLLDAVNHLDRPNTVHRTSDQAVERHIRVVKMGAFRHVGGVYDDFIEIVEQRGSVVIKDGVAGIHKASVLGILITFGDVVRPAVVPSDTGFVF